MLESVLILLIYLAVLVLIVRLLMWAIPALGIPLPASVIQVIWVIVALLALLYIVRFLVGAGHLPQLW